MDASEARRKRLKALAQSAADAGEGGGGSTAASLANPFADDATPKDSGPFNFYR